MPRLLPRLLEKISLEKDAPKYFPFKRRPSRVSRHKPLPPRPSFNPADYPVSILFSPAPNPVTTPREYDIRKSLPPVPRLPRNPVASPIKYGHDTPREMTNEERAWWSSPYLRMLASPMRHCAVTERHLPADFLVRLGAVRIPGGSKHQTTIIPDGLQHTKFAARCSPRALHVSCNRKAISELTNHGTYHRLTRNLNLYSNLQDYIADMLRARVLQELELHGDQLPFKPRHKPENGTYSSSIRRLTRYEWKSIKESGIVPYPNAIALLVVPPPNKDPSTGKRPDPSMFSEPPVSGIPLPSPNPLPLCEMFHTASETMSLDDGNPSEPDLLPNSLVPLYNGVTMFPYPAQRAYLYSQLTRILSCEAKKRLNKTRVIEKKNLSATAASPNDKASHAFMLCSDQEIAKIGDVAGVAIALWRVRMYEGGGWEQENTWARDPPKYEWRSERYNVGSAAR